MKQLGPTLYQRQIIQSIPPPVGFCRAGLIKSIV